MTDGLQPLAGLLAQVRDLKRVRDARGSRSLAERAFGRAWARLAAGEALVSVALSETAAAVAAVRLAGLDARAMTANGLTDDEALAALGRAFDDAAVPLDADLRRSLRDTIGPVHDGGPEPAFVEALVRQPRAGATAPGLPRIVLEPAESHADHSLCTAVFGVLLAPTFGADPGRVFLASLAHHLFNTSLPDAGYAADTLLGDALVSQMANASRERALAGLPDALVAAVREALRATHADAFETPDARAFHAADVLDRVLEMAWHERAARFRLADALGDDTAAGQLDICHAGFYQSLQRSVLESAGLVPAGLWDSVPAGDGAAAPPARATR